MSALSDFVAMKSGTPKPTAVVIENKIVDGVAGGEWTAGDLTAEAFAAGVIDLSTPWDEAVGQVEAILAGDLAKHEGPGPHPGTGTSQDVHGGAGGAQPVSGREKGFESTAEKARRMLFEEENQEEVVTVKAEGHESKNFTLRDARRFLGEIHEDTWVDVTWVKQDQGLERFAGVPVYKATISHSGLYDPEQLAEKIKNDGLKMGTSWHNRPPSVYFTTSLEQAHKYATEYFTNADTSGGYGIVEFRLPPGTLVFNDSLDQAVLQGGENSFRIETPVPPEFIDHVWVFSPPKDGKSPRVKRTLKRLSNFAVFFYQQEAGDPAET